MVRAEGERATLWNPCEIVLEDGTVARCRSTTCPADLPIGYHDLVPLDGGPPTRLVVHPATCPAVPRAWGVAAQVYALWSAARGASATCATFAGWPSRVAAGGGAVLVSPLHQPAPTRRRNQPVLPEQPPRVEPAAARLDAPPPPHLRCRPDELIDRDEVWIAKRSVLEAEFDAHSRRSRPAGRSPADAGTDRRVERPLRRAARTTGAALARPRADDPDARCPAARSSTSGAVDGRRRSSRRSAPPGSTMIGDLAVGFSPLGADAWEFQDLLALDMRIGAPPDPFNPDGQSWGIPPFVPWRLRAALYQPFIDTMRAALRGMDGLRIDHVMGLFRQFWVPAGGEPRRRRVRAFPADELLAIMAIEATRAGAFVVGEDLGTVEADVHHALGDAASSARRCCGSRTSRRRVAGARAGHGHHPRSADAGDGFGRRIAPTRWCSRLTAASSHRPRPGRRARGDFHAHARCWHHRRLPLMTTDDGRSNVAAQRAPPKPLRTELGESASQAEVSQLLAGDRPPGPPDSLCSRLTAHGPAKVSLGFAWAQGWGRRRMMTMMTSAACCTPIASGPTATPSRCHRSRPESGHVTSTSLVTTTTLPPVDPQLIADCVEYVMFGAFTQNPLLTAMWDAAGQNADVLRDDCESLGRTDPGTLVTLSDGLADLEVVLQNTTTSTTSPRRGVSTTSSTEPPATEPPATEAGTGHRGAVTVIVATGRRVRNHRGAMTCTPSGRSEPRSTSRSMDVRRRSPS